MSPMTAEQIAQALQEISEHGEAHFGDTPYERYEAAGHHAESLGHEESGTYTRSV